MRIHRLLGIILLIESRGIVKAKELAHALETSERTIYRDIDILCEAGIPIRSISGPTGGFTFMDGYKVNIDKLHSDDIINLLLSGMGIRPAQYTEKSLALKNAIIKLENSVPEVYRADIKKAKEKFFFDPKPWWKDVTVNRNLDIIRRAVWSANKLRIQYIKFTGEQSERIIRPYGLIVKDSGWYLAAYCEKRNEERIFKCDRINEAVIINETFNIPDEFSLESFWLENIQLFKEQAINNSKRNYNYPVTIRLKQEKKELLNGFEVIEELIKSGYYYYTIDMISYYTACTVLFPLSDRVEILEPKEIKDYIVNKAQCILRLNQNL